MAGQLTGGQLVSGEPARAQAMNVGVHEHSLH
jgi:hypothetical protein